MRGKTRGWQWSRAAAAVLLVMAAGCASTVNGPAQTSIPLDDAVPAAPAAPDSQAGIAADPGVVVAAGRYRKEYVLAPQDVVEVTVLKHPEVSRSCLIRPDGYITLPILDDVKAAGLTPAALDARLTGLFSERLQKPEVTIIVTDLRPPMVYVLGEVAQARAVPLREAQTALQAVANAGGFTVRAKEKSVVVIRLTEDDRLVATAIQVQPRGKGARYMALGNVPLQPDDIVFVPKRAIARMNLFFNESVNPILATVNNMFATYTNFKLIEVLEKNLENAEDQQDYYYQRQ